MRRCIVFDFHVFSPSIFRQPSIYPAPTPDVVLLETPTALEQNIGVARRKVEDTFADAHAHVQGVVSRWIGVEHAIESMQHSLFLLARL